MDIIHHKSSSLSAPPPEEDLPEVVPAPPVQTDAPAAVVEEKSVVSKMSPDQESRPLHHPPVPPPTLPLLATHCQSLRIVEVSPCKTETVLPDLDIFSIPNYQKKPQDSILQG